MYFTISQFDFYFLVQLFNLINQNHFIDFQIYLFENYPFYTSYYYYYCYYYYYYYYYYYNFNNCFY